MEDLADEVFFDKLVNDDDNVALDFMANDMPSALDTSLPGIAHRNGSDGVKDSEKLSFSEKGSEIYDGVKVRDDKGVGEKKNALESQSSFEFPIVSATNITEKSTVLNSADSFEFANNGSLQTEASVDTALSKSKGSGVTGVKEVEWSVFSADSALDVGNGSGSYSDFFTMLGDDSSDPSRDVVDGFSTDTANTSSGRDTLESVYLENSDHGMYKQGYNGSEVQQNFDCQDLTNNQNWENLYPGWKFDATSGQWYQIEGYGSGLNSQGNTDWISTTNWSEGMTEGSYLPQSVVHSTGTVSDIGANEGVTNWNQASEHSGGTANSSHWNQGANATSTSGSMTYWNQGSSTNNGYPSHVVFDPQYPGWYYDTIAQEWRSLDAYNLSSYAQGQDQLKQNGLASSETIIKNDNQKTYDACSKFGNHNSQVLGSQGQGLFWSGSLSNSSNQGSNYGQSQQLGSHYGQDVYKSSHTAHPVTKDFGDTIPYEMPKRVENEISAITEPHSFTSRGSFDHQYNPPGLDTSEHKPVSDGYFNHQSSHNFPQRHDHGSHQSFCDPTSGRSSEGRPAHALVTFGFGGKLIVTKEDMSRRTSSYGGQNPEGSSITVINLTEVVTENADGTSFRLGDSDYLRTLGRQSFPSPLHCGSGGVKELNRWFEEKIGASDPPMDNRQREMRLLLSLLKLSCQYYGKLRSPIGSDTVLKESDVPEVAVARLFASSRTNAVHLHQNSIVHCLQKLPSEGQMRATAAEVQSLLVSGRKREALHCAQEGHLWGPALVLAAQLGDQFYVDTVKQMSLRQLVPGSPLRTLCLLIAGEQAEVFKFDASASPGMFGDVNWNQQAVQYDANSMLDDWEANLAVIIANRTKDDELVLINLGDCMWKDRSDVIAAHICYLVADANFEPYSDTARLCLIGADHWKSPRTYASPEAIQRTEIYEYSKALGNSQFVLLPFQPYKLIYAHMLAEVGRLSDASKYCQSVLKSLKTGRASELEKLRQSVSALDERIKNHQQGGFATNLDPTRFMGKLFNLFDSTANRVLQSGGNAFQTCQSTAEMSSLINSTSPAAHDERGANSARKTKHNRSVSEPDIGRSHMQDFADSSNEANCEAEKSGGGRSRLGRFGFGSHLLQKTVGLVLGSRQKRQAKLGEKNKFYYDEKLKRWVEEGAEPPAEEVAPPAPPTSTSAFQNGRSEYNQNGGLSKESSNGSPDSKNPSIGRGSGIPPLPPTSNQCSVRGRMGVRSRYVDTFNKGGGSTPTFAFQSPSVPFAKPTSSNIKTNFFVPKQMNSQENTDISNQHTSLNDENHSHENVPPPGHPPPSSSVGMQRSGSMDNITSQVTTAGTTTTGSSSAHHHHRRGASWGGGSLGGIFNPPPSGDVNWRPSGDVSGDDTLVHQSGGSGNYSDELQEVEL